MSLPPHLRELADHVSNWGRWGLDDQRGTLNLIDDAAVARGFAAVRDNWVISLAIPFDEDGPQWGGVLGRDNPKRTMLMVNSCFTDDPGDFTTSDDRLEMGVQAATHWDSLAHVGYEGLLYNGVPMSAVDETGAAKLGAEHVGPVVSRGVLVDIARAKGVDHFDKGYAITGADLDKACAATGVTVEPGDVLLVRTGQMAHLPHDKQRYSYPSPGLSTQSIEWLFDHDVAAVATDTLVFEAFPCEDPKVLLPVHMIHLRDMGLLQGQNFALDELAAACAEREQWTFLFVANPLPLTHALGSPVAPVAIL